MVILYAETPALRDEVEGPLAGLDLTLTEDRTEFERAVSGARIGVVVGSDFDDADVTWLRGLFGQSLHGPSCVVIASLSLERVQRFRDLGRDRFRIVWLGEVDDRLRVVLEELGAEWQNPLALLGQRIVHGHPVRPSVRDAITHVCYAMSNNGLPSRRPPDSSVGALARRIRIEGDTLSRYWRRDVPLKCGPKQFLMWATLMWAVRRGGNGEPWSDIAARLGVSRRTLERYSADLAGCTLAATVRQPGLIERRFESWVTTVEKTPRMAQAASGKLN